MAELRNIAMIEDIVTQAVNKATITDIHTHLFPPSHGQLLLWGVDEVLTYQYMVAELFTLAPRTLTPEKFWKLSKRQQADVIWEHVFIEHGPLSEATRGVMTCLTSLGFDLSKRDLTPIRKWFDAQKVETYIPKVLDLAGVNYAVMTNDPFSADEAGYWNDGLPGYERFKTALRIDTLVLNWPAAAKAMRAAGYKTAANADAASFAAARKFLTDWAAKIKPLYMAASLPPDFAYPSKDPSTRTLDKVVLPVARELGLPVAMMIGVRRGVNPALGQAGDAMGVADPSAVLHLCQANGDVKFLVTMLSRVNQHELCVLARKFGNLHLFGCWWFCNNPSIIEEITRMRLELLGTAATLQHSDARVLDQLIYKWKHTRAIVAKVLTEKYKDQFVAGWRPTEAEIARDTRALLGGSFEDFLAK